MDLDTYARFFLALVFVLALIGLAAWLVRRFGPGGRSAPRWAKSRRLKLLESLPLDGRRRLVLVARDEAEHLILLGASAETVVERTIGPSGTKEFTDSLNRILTAGASGDEPPQ
ncbi:MAG: FliO/MopB family protein [Alphaproteobacteria bacterium]